MREVAAVELVTRDLVGVALRSVEDLEVSLPQLRLLRLLYEAGELGATRCAQELGIAASSVTRLADRLAASGHLARETDPGNRSAVVLSLTEAGRTLVREVAERRRGLLGDALDRLDPGLRSRCVEALEVLHDVLAVAEDPRVPF